VERTATRGHKNLNTGKWGSWEPKDCGGRIGLHADGPDRSHPSQKDKDEAPVSHHWCEASNPAEQAALPVQSYFSTTQTIALQHHHTGLPLSKRKISLSSPLETTRASVSSAPSSFTFDPVTWISSPFLKVTPMSSRNDLGHK